MKKTFSLVLVVSLLCSCSSFTLLKIKKDKFKKDFKKILVIPLYVDKQLIPNATEEQPAFNFYSKQYKKDLYTFVNSIKNIFDDEVKNILEKGTYSLKTVRYNGEINNLFMRTSRTVRFNKLYWSHNYFFTLENNTIEKLIKEYNVDGILFHYIQVLKINELIEYSTHSSLYGPKDMLAYQSVMVDKKGNVIYNNYNGRYNLIRIQAYKDEGVFLLQDWKISVESIDVIKKKLTKNYIANTLRNAKRASYCDFVD